MGGLARSAAPASSSNSFSRFMRMHADTAPDIGKFLRHRPHAGKALQFGADADADAHAGGAGARHHRVHLAGIVGKIQMAMAVDQTSRHHSARPRAVAGQIARRASARSGAAPDAGRRRGAKALLQPAQQRHPALQTRRAAMRLGADAVRQGSRSGSRRTAPARRGCGTAFRPGPAAPADRARGAWSISRSASCGQRRAVAGRQGQAPRRCCRRTAAPARRVRRATLSGR